VLHAAEQERADVATRRLWRRLSPLGMPAKRLVFIDDTSGSTKMTRQRSRAPCGERLVAKSPHGHWRTTTFVAGLRSDGIAAPLVIDSAMNGQLFLAYVEQQLAPTLQPGDVVVMDNLPNLAGLADGLVELSSLTRSFSPRRAEGTTCPSQLPGHDERSSRKI